MERKRALAVSAALLILLSAMSAGAQARLEVNLDWPLVIGWTSESTYLGNDTVDVSQFRLLVPDFRAYYQFGDGLLTGGIGVRVPTLIIVSLIYPEGFVEVNLKPFSLEATLGGFLFGAFGLGVGTFSAQPLLLSDLSASVELASWFRLGGGVYLIMPTDSTFSKNFAYIGYIGGRFIFMPK